MSANDCPHCESIRQGKDTLVSNLSCPYCIVRLIKRHRSKHNVMMYLSIACDKYFIDIQAIADAYFELSEGEIGAEKARANAEILKGYWLDRDNIARHLEVETIMLKKKLAEQRSVKILRNIYHP